MGDRFFLDTNVLVYTFDRRLPAKRQAAVDLVERALEGNGTTSYQVVQEFLNVALRKFESPLSATAAEDYLREVLGPLCSVFGSVSLYRRSLSLRERWRFHFYDCLVIAGALEAQCKVLYSEDLQHGQQIESLRIVDPFRE